MRNKILVLAAALMIVSLGGCPVGEVVCDHSVRCAKRLITVDPAFSVDDDLHADEDRVDWKFLVPRDDGIAVLKVIVGDPFNDQRHGMIGSILVLDEEANPLQKEQILPSQFKYELRWEVTAGVKYLVKLTADKRRAPYSVKLVVEPPPPPPRDPCDGVVCDDDDDVCRDGECVSLDSKARKRCPRGCARGEYCRKKRGSWSCAKDPCYRKRCDDGERCTRPRGKCVPRKTRTKPQPDSGSSSSSSSASSGDKGDHSSRPPTETKPTKLSASVTSTDPVGGGTMVTLSKGKKHGVAKGNRCTACGATGSIREVYRVRSRCKIAKPVSACQGKRTGSIVLK